MSITENNARIRARQQVRDFLTIAKQNPNYIGYRVLKLMESDKETLEIQAYNNLLELPLNTGVKK